MSLLFRSKSCGRIMGSSSSGSGSSDVQFNTLSPFQNGNNKKEKNEEELESDDDEETTRNNNNNEQHHQQQQQQQFAILDIVVGALKRSLLVTCSVEEVERDDVVSSSLDISWPTEVRHVSHVTFDRFNGFLGLPSELQPEVPSRVPSASVKVFGVSAKSMQCSYDDRGNSVPTLLLRMQKQLYSEGGLHAEGIFRINPENSQEEFVRDQLNRGVVPQGIDVHCLSGLMKAWFRELPTGVLDSLTPEQVMLCNTEEDCTNLVKLLPSTEAALLDWAINLMADVVENEQFNKMNAHNVAMVFAPNMTQMADPLTALIHAVQVMNFLKTLIFKTLREREKSVTNARLLSLFMDSPSYKDEPPPFESNREESCEQTEDTCDTKASTTTKRKFSRTSTLGRIEWNVEKLRSSEEEENEKEVFKSFSSGSTTTSRYESGPLENSYSYSYRRRYDSEHWLRLRNGVRKLCRHPVFQLSKPTKKPTSLGIVNTSEGGGEAWA